jgi:hypothetical protein
LLTILTNKVRLGRPSSLFVGSGYDFVEQGDVLGTAE